MTADRPGMPLRDYFAGIAEYTFHTRVGIADPALIDYISDLLTRFIRADSLYNVRDLGGRRLGEVALMMAEAEYRIGEARRDVHRHIGDFALFWTGVYPEALGHKPIEKPTDLSNAAAAKKSEANDRFIDYCTHGKRAYHIASTIPGDDAKIRGELLERLSEEFELCAFGLSEARKEWERRDEDGGWRLVVFN
jgi:hypothetical protein